MALWSSLVVSQHGTCCGVVQIGQGSLHGVRDSIFSSVAGDQLETKKELPCQFIRSCQEGKLLF